MDVGAVPTSSTNINARLSVGFLYWCITWVGSAHEVRIACDDSQGRPLLKTCFQRCGNGVAERDEMSGGHSNFPCLPSERACTLPSENLKACTHQLHQIKYLIFRWGVFNFVKYFWYCPVRAKKFSEPLSFILRSKAMHSYITE